MRTKRSRDLIHEVLATKQEPRETFAIKPNGLWYSVDNGWEEWCSAEMPDWIAGTHAYDVELGEENILMLDSHDKVLEFAIDYPNHDNPAMFPGVGSYWIDWQRVAEVYDGIEVNPYFDGLKYRQNLLWYYAWDCTSGCIWRPRGVKLTLKTPVVDTPQAFGLFFG